MNGLSEPSAVKGFNIHGAQCCLVTVFLCGASCSVHFYCYAGDSVLLNTLKPMAVSRQQLNHLASLPGMHVILSLSLSHTHTHTHPHTRMD